MILVSYDSFWGFSEMLQGESHVFSHYVIICAACHILLNVCIKVKKKLITPRNVSLGCLWLI